MKGMAAYPRTNGGGIALAALGAVIATPATASPGTAARSGADRSAHEN